MILVKCCRNVTLASFKNLQWKSVPKMQKYHFTLSFCIDLKYSKILKTKLFSMLLNLFKGLSRLDMTERQRTQTYLLKEMLLSTLVRFWFPILLKTCPLNKFFQSHKTLQYDFSKPEVWRNSWPGQASWPSCEPESEMDYQKKSWPPLNF